MLRGRVSPGGSRLRWGMTFAVLILVGTACSAQPHSVATRSQTDDRGGPIRALGAAVPALQVPNYDTSGFYPQVAGGGVDWRPVNAALHDQVAADQAAYAADARQSNFVGSDAPPDVGTYRLDFSPPLMFATAAVASTLYPSLKLFPGGNDGSGWMDLTLTVPAALRISLQDIVSTAKLAGFAAAVRAGALATSECLRTANDPAGEQFWAGNAAGFTPTFDHFRHFALTHDGLDVGLEQSQAGPAACSTVRVKLPWSTVRPFLTDRGRALMGSLR